MPSDRVPEEVAGLLSRAGSLCSSLVSGILDPATAPEALALWSAARSTSAPGSPLQWAWVSYQDAVLELDRTRHREADEELHLLSVQYASEKARAEASHETRPPEHLAHDLAVATANVETIERQLPLVLKGLEEQFSQTDASLQSAVERRGRTIAELEARLRCLHAEVDADARSREEAVRIAKGKRAAPLKDRDPTIPRSQILVEIETRERAQAARREDLAAAEREQASLSALLLEAEQDASSAYRRHAVELADARRRLFEAEAQLRSAEKAVHQHERDALARMSRTLSSIVSRIETLTLAQAGRKSILERLRESDSTRHPKRPSYVYYVLTSPGREAAPWRSTHPNKLTHCVESIEGTFEITGEPWYRDALSAAFPASAFHELRRDGFKIVWEVHAADTAALRRFVSCLTQHVTLGTALDGYFALDWYSEEVSPGDWHRTPTGELLYQAKYHQNALAVRTLAEQLAVVTQAEPRYARARWILSVPCLATKPFDAPQEIARALAAMLQKELGMPHARKTRETLPMKDIDEHERKRSNVDGAFAADAPAFAGDDVILVDDTYGSGYTMWELCRVLRASGAHRVLGLTCAKNRGFR